MNIKSKLGAALAAVGLSVLGVVGIAAPAQAHVPKITVTCDGVHIEGHSYNPAKTNTWTVSLDGVVTSGTFGESVDETIPVPQGGKTTTVGAQIADEDQTPAYSEAFSGSVGPCGTIIVVPPPVIEPSCTTITGSHEIEGDGVIEVDGNWASKSIPVPFSGKLKDIGTVLNIDATPLQYVGLHVDLSDGRTITFEEEPSYAGKLWSESAFSGVSAGMGYVAFGTIEEFIASAGNVDVSGIRLLYTHPDPSSTKVTSFDIGCTHFTFKPKAVVVPPKNNAPELANTGLESASTLGVAGGLLGLGFLSMFASRGFRFRKGKHHSNRAVTTA